MSQEPRPNEASLILMSLTPFTAKAANLIASAVPVPVTLIAAIILLL